MSEGLSIRPERDDDHPVIADVVRAAFVRHPDEVATFVERIRASEQFIPELALVAEDSSGVIAHVMLSWVGVEGGSRTSILNLTRCRFLLTASASVWAHADRDALGRAERRRACRHGRGHSRALPSSLRLQRPARSSSPRIRRSPTKVHAQAAPDQRRPRWSDRLSDAFDALGY
jgi:hypothetical protein